MGVPVVALLLGPTPRKISKISQKDMSSFTFQVSEDFVEYKICVVSSKNDSVNVAVPIGTTNGSVNLAATGSFDATIPISGKINGADLEAASPGDGQKIVKIFVKSTTGDWSV